MTSDIVSSHARLIELLSEALVVADAIDQPIAAIHIDAALLQVSEASRE